jgi:periplasmic copper chaperone A
MRRWVAELFLIATFAISPAAASGGPVISQAWLRLLPGGLPAGGYFTLKNDGAKPLALTGARSSACGMLMLHKSSTASGMAQMDAVQSIDVAARGTIHFSPGGYHLMCMSPIAALKRGQTVKVIFQFRGASPVIADFHVTDARGRF